MKTSTEKIAELYNHGLGPKDIAASMDMPRSTVKAAIHRLKEKGLVQPRDKSTSRCATTKRLGFNIGVIWPAMDRQNIEPEIREWILIKAHKEGYLTLADKAVDLLVEEYYNAQPQE